MCKDFDYIDEETFLRFDEACDAIGKKLYRLRESCKKTK